MGIASSGFPAITSSLALRNCSDGGPVCAQSVAATINPAHIQPEDRASRIWRRLRPEQGFSRVGIAIWFCRVVSPLARGTWPQPPLLCRSGPISDRPATGDRAALDRSDRAPKIVVAYLDIGPFYRARKALSHPDRSCEPNKDCDRPLWKR